MTILEFGALGEFVASIAVLITLVFLTLQMKQKTRMLIRANARQTPSDHVNALRGT